MAGGLQEKNIVLTLGGKLKRLLEGQGIAVVMTRTADKFIPLKQRVIIEKSAVAGFSGKTAFVSLHVNAGPAGGSANGVSVFHSEVSSKGKALATDVFTRIRERAPQMNQYNDGVLADEEDGVLNDDSFLMHALYVLKYTQSPAILVELGFITSAADRILLDDPIFQDKAMLGVADGLLTWFNK